MYTATQVKQSWTKLATVLVDFQSPYLSRQYLFWRRYFATVEYKTEKKKQLIVTGMIKLGRAWVRSDDTNYIHLVQETVFFM